MTFFAVFLFAAFGVVGLTLIGGRAYRRIPEVRPVVAVGLGVGMAWLANLNMWTSWHIGNLRYDWVGITVTGLAIGGAAVALYSIVGSVSSLHRKLDDEAEQIERTDLRRVA
jgi:mannose/fructose/N-acetylgalactosamine-specific phosphotransferase system component IIC